jgi:hypothetical protein
MRNIELLYLAVAYGMSGILFAMNRTKKHLTVSEIGAGSRLGRHVFFWGLLGSGLLFGTLMIGWLIPHFALPLPYKVLVIILIGFQVLTGIIPARGKRLNMAHIISAFSLAACMFLMIVLLALAKNINGFIRVADALLAVMMLAQVLASKKALPAEYLRREKVFFACWHAAIFITVYLG